METEVLKEQHYVEELVEIIRSGLPKEELIDRLSDYHDNDIADALTKLTPDERRERMRQRSRSYGDLHMPMW